VTGRARPFRVGLLTREFFAEGLGGFGGFGFAAKRVVQAFAHPAAPVEVVVLTPAKHRPAGGWEVRQDGTTVRFVSGDKRRDARAATRYGFELLLAIDWHPQYATVALALPRTPLLVWSRDPRPESAWRFIDTLRLPDGAGDGTGDGNRDGDGPPRLEVRGAHRGVEALAVVRRASLLAGRPFEVAFPARFLTDRFAELYGWRPRRAWLLGTPLDPPAPTPHPTPHPAPGAPGRGGGPLEVVLLGRLDPVKRPWVVWALAAARPDVRVTVLGQARRPIWQPPDLANVDHLGHVDGASKRAVLERADVLVNTSIHEGLPVSFCEGLTHGMALLSVLDPDGVASRFGEAVPNVPGDGLDAVPHLAAALDRLAADPERRRAIDREARRWATTQHADEPFLRTLEQILLTMGVERGVAAVRATRATLTSATPTGPSGASPGARADPPRRRDGAAGSARWPDFLVVGAARAATTSLHRALRDSGVAWVPAQKEPRFFASDGRAPEYRGPHDEVLVNRRGVWDRRAYLDLFADAPAGAAIGEVSPLYLWEEAVSARIHDANPSCRIVAVLRDPAERAFSQWRLHRAWDEEPLAFEAALAAEDDRLAAGWSPLYAYRGRGCYARLLRPYLDRFGPERVLVVRFEDLVAAPDPTLQGILAFVTAGAAGPGRPERGGRGELVEANAAARVPRSPGAARLLERARPPREASGALPAARRRLAEAGLALNARTPRLDPATRGRLVAAHRRDLEDLEHLTGLDVSSWLRP
jgi:glycosyltransferase involved in cell wall biosynthesis